MVIGIREVMASVPVVGRMFESHWARQLREVREWMLTTPVPEGSQVDSSYGEVRTWDDFNRKAMLFFASPSK